MSQRRPWIARTPAHHDALLLRAIADRAGCRTLQARASGSSRPPCRTGCIASPADRCGVWPWLAQCLALTMVAACSAPEAELSADAGTVAGDTSGEVHADDADDADGAEAQDGAARRGDHDVTDASDLSGDGAQLEDGALGDGGTPADGSAVADVTSCDIGADADANPGDLEDAANDGGDLDAEPQPDIDAVAPDAIGGDADVVDAVDVGPPDADATGDNANTVEPTPTDAADASGDSSGGADAADVGPPPKVTPVDPLSLPLAQFTDATKAYGVSPDTIHQPCVAVADFDGNGRDDFVVVELTGPGNKATIQTRLLSASGTKVVGSPFDGSTMQPNFGCTAVDLNSDGHQDLLFGGFSGLSLYLGDGKGGFVDKSAQWLPYLMDFESFSVVPADLDGDGDLDLYVGAGFAPPSCQSLQCAYTDSDLLCTVNPPIPSWPNLQDRVLIQGATPPLVDETPKWNVPGSGTQTVAAALDVDGDGKVDMLVADDFGSARILRNLGATFVSYDVNVGLHPYSGAMGWTAADFDGDLLPDLVIAESGPTPIYRQLPKPGPGLPFQFEDIGWKYDSWGPHWTASSWSPIAADFDHDGQEDLLIANASHVTAEMASNPAQLCALSQQAGVDSLFVGLPSVDVLLLRQADGSAKAHRLVGGKHAHIIIVEQREIDLDDDGDLDLVQTRPGPQMMTSQVRILRNDLVKKGGSVRVRLKGKAGNLDALGAKVYATIGGKVRVRWLFGSGAFGGLPARVAHFGLGSAKEAKDVKVIWPDGKETALGVIPAGNAVVAKWP